MIAIRNARESWRRYLQLQPKMWKILPLLFVVFAVNGITTATSASATTTVELNDENWRKVLRGEWMVLL